MRVVVTGAAGFIGSRIAQRHLALGDEVIGIDCLTSYYPREEKLERLEPLRAEPGFGFVGEDLCEASLEGLLAGAQVVYHEAGQPGVRASWAHGFADYCSDNVLATQRLLEAALGARVGRVVYASSSSVYGNAVRYPVSEDDLPAPISPYGVTKLAAEHLCRLYATTRGLSTVSLRYFTVYGPGQRPDMAFRRLVDAALDGTRFPLYGSGHQVRDFTYVDDVVDANLLAARAEVAPGAVMNVAGGSHAEMLEVIERVGALAGRPVALERLEAQAGDVDRTEASTERARALLGWQPSRSLDEGLAAMVAWGRARHRGGLTDDARAGTTSRPTRGRSGRGRSS